MADSFLLAIGSYSGADTDGIHLVRLDARSGAPERVGGARGIVNPSFVVAHPTGRFLAAISERMDGAGAVEAFALRADAPLLEPLGAAPSGGVAPCHCSFDAEGRNLLLANYESGTIVVMPFAGGSLGAATARIAHRGSGPDPKRQAGPHTHQIQLDPSGRFAVVCDLGADRLVVYRFDAAAGTLARHGETVVTAGAGPRHLAFAPNGRYAYLACELDATVRSFAYDATAGSFAPIGVASTVPPLWKGTNYPAAIRVSADGPFVFVSNRGRDDIAVFAVGGDGTLSPRGHFACGGKWPRDFALVGDYLVCASQESNLLVSFRVDAASGALSSACSTMSLMRPVCVAVVS